MVTRMDQVQNVKAMAIREANRIAKENERERKSRSRISRIIGSGK